MASSRLLKSNHLRGDFVFRDVYKRNAYSTFAGNQASENSTLYIDENENALKCTSQVTTYSNGIGALHLYTRNGVEFDNSNVASASVSIDPSAATFRSSNTHVKGGFTVRANLLLADPSTSRVGINQSTPDYTLDVNGDCNIRGNIMVNGSSLQTMMQTRKVGFGTATPFLYQGPGTDYSNGLPFFATMEIAGENFLTTNAEQNNSVFTFSKTGTFLIQVEVEGAYPFLPEGEVSTYFVKNGNAAVKHGLETTMYSGAGAFGCTKTYILNAQENDNVRFIIDSVSHNEYIAGIQACRISFLDIGGGINIAKFNDITANTIAGTITTAEQPNIRTLGTLNSIQVSGNASVGNLATNSISATAISASTLSTTGNISTGNAVTVGTNEIWNSQNTNERWRLVVGEDASGNFFQIEAFVNSQWKSYFRLDK